MRANRKRINESPHTTAAQCLRWRTFLGPKSQGTANSKDANFPSSQISPLLCPPTDWMHRKMNVSLIFRSAPTFHKIPWLFLCHRMYVLSSSLHLVMSCMLYSSIYSKNQGIHLGRAYVTIKLLGTVQVDHSSVQCILLILTFECVFSPTHIFLYSHLFSLKPWDVLTIIYSNSKCFRMRDLSFHKLLRPKYMLRMQIIYSFALFFICLSKWSNTHMFNLPLKLTPPTWWDHRSPHGNDLSCN